MSERATYIHGTEPSEQGRLAALNRLTNETFVAWLEVGPGMRVLEVGSGLGLLAADVASAADGIHVIGVEQSAAQISAAVKHSHVRYVPGDAHALDFEDGSFDLVYARYVLEHVANPVTVVKEMRRVVRPGGRVAACENDVTLLRLDPPCPAFDRVWSAFQQHQRALGGDSQIGRRLYRVFREAGFSTIALSVQPEAHWHGSFGFDAWVANLIGNIDGAHDGLVDSKLLTHAEIDMARGELTALSQNLDASSHFMWNRAMAVR